MRKGCVRDARVRGNRGNRYVSCGLGGEKGAKYLCENGNVLAGPKARRVGTLTLTPRQLRQTLFAREAGSVWERLAHPARGTPDGECGGAHEALMRRSDLLVKEWTSGGVRRRGKWNIYIDLQTNESKQK